MAAVTSVLPVPRAYASPDSEVIVRYVDEGWHTGVLSGDGTAVVFNGTPYGFDPAADEFVESTPATRAFLGRHAGSLLVRVAQSEVEYLVSDATITVERLITMINALLFRAGRAQLPPVDDDHGSYILYEAAKLCHRGVLGLTTVSPNWPCRCGAAHGS